MTSLTVIGAVVLLAILSVWVIKSLAARKAVSDLRRKALEAEMIYKKRADKIERDARLDNPDDTISGL